MSSQRSPVDKFSKQFWWKSNFYSNFLHKPSEGENVTHVVYVEGMIHEQRYEL